MPTGVYPRPPITFRLWSKVDKSSGPDGCWIWIGCKASSGYGQIGRGRRGEGQMPTHRLAWELTNGPIPDGLWVLHKCDNPPCCNPAHLFLGTRTDNMRDCSAKGRLLAQSNPAHLARGSRHGVAKLKESDIPTIRKRLAYGDLQWDIARDYGVTQTAIWSVKTGKTWKHVA